MRSFLHKKGVELSLKTYFVTSLSYMALGLFSSLIIGLIIRTTGQQIPILEFLVPMGQLAMDLMGPAIGVAVAYGLKAPRLVLFSAVITGAAGALLGGGPAGSFIAALIATEIGKLVSQETRLDIIVTPFVTIATGYTVATTIGPVIAGALDYFGQLIMWSVDRQPFVMGILVALLMGLALTAPISSAAIAFMLGLEGLAAGAATVGCAAQMIGFATSSYRENGFSGFVALGIGTSMLQIGNIVKNPLILIPPTVAGIVLAPFATIVFQMVNNPAGAGMGTSGLVGQIMTFTVMGFTWEVAIGVLLLHFIGPAVISLVLSEWLRKVGLIKLGDMKIEQ
ncbi:PTS sugar transporter subunit IIC [Anaerobacillus alkalilacustris]|uniref:PTS sugar transporter subunit IIC n=1 Tax=Anaerobacillus alkalilacustris TaxID=393763 RepID=A0A1S2LK37_9BACI|nr:PTS sugar transporter subunit IIC [Anaerobacillus alkalilacustris]OIJ12453.1 PTS sugar transporter subunit IIC [Anaerobacillus alkalilacustris]